MVSLGTIRRRSAAQGGKDARRGEEASASHMSLARARDTKPEARRKGAGQAREHRTPPRWAIGRLRGAEYRRPGARNSWSGRWGTAVPRDPREGRRRRGSRHLEGPLGATPGSPTVARQRQSMAHQAQRSPAMVCTNGCHVIDQDVLREASRLTRKTSAPGRDQGTATPYAEPVEDNRRDRSERLRDQRYGAPPVERVGIAKAGGKKRPRGQPGFEDTMVQRAVVRILEAIFAQDVHAFSHGFRKGHRPHQALHARREPCRTWPSNGRVDAEGRGVCDHVDWGLLREGSQQRVKEGGILRLLGTGLHAGGLEAGALTHPDKGTPQGGGAAPLLANVFLQQVLDAWWGKDVQPRRKGRGVVTRCADECSIGCALEADARRVMAVFPKRFPRFTRTMPPAKTALMAFKKPPSRVHAAGGTGSVAVLGCTHSWAQTRRGYGVIKRTTVGKRLRRCMQALWTGCRDNRPAPWPEQERTRCATRRGSSQDDGIRGKVKRRDGVWEHPERAWRSGRSRRSHTGHRRWQKCVACLQKALALPQPRIIHHLSPCQGQQREAPNGVSPVW